MRITRNRFMAGLAVALVFGIVGCAVRPPSAGQQATPASVVPTVAVTTPSAAASPTLEVTPVPTVSASVSATFVAVVDGDTVETSEGTVRIIGIDTPERGECGHPEASAAIEGVGPLAGQEDADDHWWTEYTSCAQLKKNTAGHPTGPLSKDDPQGAAIYDWFANGTGHRGDGDFDSLACE